MAKVVKERVAPQIPAGAVTFLIGMRINKLWQVWKWMPVMAAMGKMLPELMKNPELGLVGRPRTFLSGRTILVWQQWASFEALEKYAQAPEHEHVPAWRNFNRRSRGNAAVGIYHETYIMDHTTTEAVYVNMPPFGLAGAFGAKPAEGESRSARQRLRKS